MRNLARDFGAEVPTWGYSVSPFLTGKALIVNPGSRDASVAGLDPATGKTLWKTPGPPAAYAAFALAKLHAPQLVGFDAESIGAWDPATGKRLWKLVPPEKGDFNVPAAVPLAGRLILASENNGTRLHTWNKDGTLNQTPIATNDFMTPDTCTPVHHEGRIYAAGLGTLVCLDANNALRTIWRHEEDTFDSHTSMIAGNDRLLIQTMTGELILLDTTADQFTPISRIRPVPGAETWSNPALTPGRLFLRPQNEILCLGL
jgi:outer membrane protein assembly factor BamB